MPRVGLSLSHSTEGTKSTGIALNMYLLEPKETTFTRLFFPKLNRVYGNSMSDFSQKYQAWSETPLMSYTAQIPGAWMYCQAVQNLQHVAALHVR